MKENEIEKSLHLVVTMNPRRSTEILSNFVGMECAWGEGSAGFYEVIRGFFGKVWGNA